MRLKLSRRTSRLLKLLIDAEIAASWKGGGDPADWPAIEANLKEARKNFRDYVAQLEYYLDHYEDQPEPLEGEDY